MLSSVGAWCAPGEGCAPDEGSPPGARTEPQPAEAACAAATRAIGTRNGEQLT